jgi:hypothetical protein
MEIKIQSHELATLEHDLQIMSLKEKIKNCEEDEKKTELLCLRLDNLLRYLFLKISCMFS